MDYLKTARPGAHQPLDVLVVGEALIDVVTTSHDKVEHPGGSPANVAYGLGRLGVTTGLLTAIAPDVRGDSIENHLRSAGVILLPGSKSLTRTASATATLEPDGSAGGPHDDIATLIGDGDQGVVEGSLDMGLAMRDVLTLPPANPRGPGGGSSSRLSLFCQRQSLLLEFLLAGNGGFGAFASTSVGVGPLPAHRKAATMANALITADLDLPLDVLLNLATKVALDLEVLLDVSPNSGGLVLGEILHLGVAAQAQLLADLLGARQTDAEYVGQADLEPLVAR